MYARARFISLLPAVCLGWLTVCLSPSAHAADWAVFWAAVEKANIKGQGLSVAESRRKDPACQDAEKILEAIPLLIAALESKRYGDALNVLGEYQRRLLCLDKASLHALDALLGLQSATGFEQLKDSEGAKLVRALFALGLLTYDQMESTDRSLWWMLLFGYQDRYWQALKDYPQSEFGVWTYNVHTGRLERFNHPTAAEMLMDALIGSDDLKSKNCYVGEMRPKSQGSGTTKTAQNDQSKMGCGVSPENPDGFGGGPASGSGPDAVACVVAVANSQGIKGQLQCMSNVLSGLMPNPHDMLTLPKSSLQGVPDRACTLSDETQAGARKDANLLEDQKGKKWYEHLGDYVSNVFMAVFDKTPDPLPSADLLSPEAADAAGKGLSALQEAAFKEHLNTLPDEQVAEERDKWQNMSLAEKQKYLEQVKKEKEEKEKAKQQQAGVNQQEGRKIDPGTGGGTCSDRTGAAARAAAAYACISGEITLPDGTTVAPPSTINPHGPMVDPDNPNAPPGSAGNGIVSTYMACLQQAGDQIRTTAIDNRCARARCIEGETCACDRPGLQLDVARSISDIQRQECLVFARCEGDGECPCDRALPQPGQKLPERFVPLPQRPDILDIPRPATPPR